ncbi:hypothetical protein [Umezawaea sp.]|uniref:hypothetical protein n=1 Tax=Umezawaea sp. TaxID=1955258 RepID=UPI002ED65B37
MPPQRTTATALTALLVAALAGCQGGGSATTDSRSFDFTADRLVIDSREVGLVVDQGAAGSVRVDRTLTGKAADAGAAALALENGVLRVGVDCGGVTLTCEAEHVVRVPPGVAVEFRGSGSRVRAEGLTGDVTATLTDDATIALAEPSGTLSLDATDSSITVTAATSPSVTAVTAVDGDVSLQFASPPQRVEARSAGGHAAVVLPAGPETYQVDAAGAQPVAHDPASTRTVVAHAGDGRATVTKAG